jgi:FkbM family methyltransferase
MINYLKKIRILNQRLNDIKPSLGLIQAFVYLIQEVRCSFLNGNRSYTLISKNSQFPLICRANTSDAAVFRQIFIETEYSCLDDLSNVELIVDCGANVGYSSAYLLTRFPTSTVICIEPDPANFMMLEKNLAPYKERVKLINTGIWSHPADLKVVETPYRDGGAWAIQVRECKLDEIPEMRATDLGTILKESGAEKISVLKMDVEGAEAVVFSKNYESWLPFVDNIAIELHDDSNFGRASDIVLNTISSCKSFDVSTCRELTVFKACL